MKTHSDAEKLIEDLPNNQRATVARVVRDGLLNCASKKHLPRAIPSMSQNQTLLKSFYTSCRGHSEVS